MGLLLFSEVSCALSFLPYTSRRPWMAFHSGLGINFFQNWSLSISSSEASGFRYNNLDLDSMFLNEGQRYL